MRILLSDGSGLTSRQTARLLHAAGHEVGVVSADPLALTHFTRAVRSWHTVPAFGDDPFAWLEAAVAVAAEGAVDVLLPTQEQVTVLATARGRAALADAGVATAVPSFAALVAVQDKLAAHATLARLGLPQPEATVVADADALARWARFPVFAKTPIGTATSGVRRLDGPADRDEAARAWAAEGAFADGGVLVQAPAAGPLAMVQAVFDDGALVAFHANRRVREGARGGASHKCSTVVPGAEEAVAALGRALRWRGALSVDVIVTDDGPLLIDVNPRLVEPANAALAGVDLVGALLDVAVGRHPARQAPGRPGVRTHQLLLAVLGAAQHDGGRRAVAAELLGAAAHRGHYRGSREELTPVAHDARAVLPLVMASTATLVRPSSWTWFSSGSVASYACSPAGWRAIRAAEPAATTAPGAR